MMVALRSVCGGGFGIALLSDVLSCERFGGPLRPGSLQKLSCSSGT